MSDWRQTFLDRCSKLDRVLIAEGNFGPGPGLWVGKREVAHFDDEQTLDIRLTKPQIRALAARSSSRTTGSACDVAAPTGSKSRCEKNPTLTSPYLWSMTRSLQTSRPRHWVLHRRVPTWPEAAGCTDPAYAELGIVPLEASTRI